MLYATCLCGIATPISSASTILTFRSNFTCLYGIAEVACLFWFHCSDFQKSCYMPHVYTALQHPSLLAPLFSLSEVMSRVYGIAEAACLLWFHYSNFQK
jgi:hypothetical protein